MPTANDFIPQDRLGPDGKYGVAPERGTRSKLLQVGLLSA